MSSPASTGAELPPEDLAQVEDEVLADKTVAAARSVEQARAHLLRCVDEMDRRRSYEYDGYLSPTAWLRDKCRLTARAASAIVRAARSLRSMPRTRRALDDGSITFPAAQMLGIAAEAHPSVFAGDESILVEQAKRLTPSALRKSLDYWRQAADTDAGTAAMERKYRRRRLNISETIDGMVRVEGDFDPEGGAIVAAAVRSLSEGSALDPSDERSGPQRRADAFVELSQAHLEASPASGRARPHISLIVDLQTLNEGRGTTSEFEDGTVIDAETARRIACDSSISRVIVNGPSDPLDIGRKTRIVPSAIRRALVVRDRGCTYDGCDRPPQWCDAHHIEPWAQGGPTSLDNLRLLCRRHHRMMHPEQAEGGPDP